MTDSRLFYTVFTVFSVSPFERGADNCDMQRIIAPTRKCGFSAMYRTSVIAILLATTCGCQAMRVQKNSNKLSSTVPDLYYGQVLDNVAMISSNPAATPYFSYPTQGTTANTLTAQASYTPGWDWVSAVGRYLFDKQAATLQGTNADAQTFQVTPVANPDNLFSCALPIGLPQVTRSSHTATATIFGISLTARQKTRL